MNLKLNKKLWLKEGFVLQGLNQEYWIGQGPFCFEPQPSEKTLYHPDFFLKSKTPWIKARFVAQLSKKELAYFLFDKKIFSHKEGEGPISNSSLFKTKLFSDGRKRDKNFLPVQEADHLKKYFKNSKRPSFIQYQSLFYQAQQAIEKGLFQKTVPVFSESFSKVPDRLLLIQNLFKRAVLLKQGWLYGVWSQQSGILGLTPEILFSAQGDRFLTMALAGTGPHPGPSLLKDKKELKEHDYVVQGLKKSLKGEIQWLKHKVYEYPFPPLKHLRADMSGRLIQEFDFERICQKLHPTAALGGYPKKSALAWLKSQPSQRQRNYFGAPLGFFHSQRESFCLVALRALEWDSGQAEISSGGGWIKESLLQKEWQELFLKRQQTRFFLTCF